MQAKNKIVAIHQPNFFPWLGYFDKIARADDFLFFDDVQFPKTGGGVWTNRVKLLISGQARWITAAIDRNYSGTREIREMHFLADNPWREKMLRSLEFNYRRHPFYSDTMNILEPLIKNNESNVAEYNIHAVTEIAQQIGLNTKKLNRSSNFSTEGSSNELLCSLTQQAGGDIYMCGGGAEGYQNDALFDEKGVGLQYQKFEHPIYSQTGHSKFIQGLSVIDAAMNLSWSEIKNLMALSE